MSRRDYRAEYRARLRLAEARGLSRRQGRGHPGLGEAGARRLLQTPLWEATFVADRPPRLVTIKGTITDAKRAGRYASALRLLAEDRITAGEFGRRTRRLGVIAGLPVVTDPSLALAVAFKASSPEWEFYERGRA